MMTCVVAPDPPSDVRDLSHERCQAMAFAAGLHRDQFTPGDSEDQQSVIDTATAIFEWFVAPVWLRLTFGPVVDQETGRPAGTIFGEKMSQLRTTQKVTATVAARDAKGYNVPDDPTTDADNITWAISDEAVATLTTSTDGRQVEIVAGTPGSTVLSATVATGAGDRVVTHAVDVIPGDIAALEISVGEPVEQDATEPEPV